jgi:hypothetical protein
VTIKRVTRGSGMTRRPRTVLEPAAAGAHDPEEVAALLAQARRNSDLDHHRAGFAGQAKRILAAAGAGPHADDSPADYARRFIGIIATIRAARASGDTDLGIRQGIRLGLFLQEHMNKHDFEPAWLHGQRFGPKPRREDALAEAIDAALLALGPKATAEAVLRHIEAIGESPIQEIAGGTIYWKRANGREARTVIETFNNRVSNRRRKIFRN